MKYERPAVLATYRVAELKKEAAVCHRYGGGDWTNPERKFHFFR